MSDLVVVRVILVLVGTIHYSVSIAERRLQDENVLGFLLNVFKKRIANRKNVIVEKSGKKML